MKPLKPIGSKAGIALGVAFFLLFFLVWSVVTLGGFVSKTFLADPFTMLESGWRLLTVHGFHKDIGITVWRVVGGFVIAAALGVPLGIAMGAYKPIEAFFEPFVSFARYLPASAFIPLLILWAGIGEAQKLAVIFIGSFFQLVLMIAVAVGNARRDLVEVVREALQPLLSGERPPAPRGASTEPVRMERPTVPEGGKVRSEAARLERLPAGCCQPAAVERSTIRFGRFRLSDSKMSRLAHRPVMTGAAT